MTSRRLFGKLKGQPTQTFLEGACTSAGTGCRTYTFCDNDQGLPLVFQEAFAKTLGNPVIFHTDGSHSAFLSVPDQEMEGLDLALREGREQSRITVN